MRLTFISQHMVIKPTLKPLRSLAHWRHSRSRRSLLPDATDAPSGLQSTVNTSSAWPGSSSLSFRVATSHTCQRQSIHVNGSPEATN